ncbi:MAG TPA: putative zinc-binding protein [Terriglobales bacterium]|nr:putative zinc-binding protein [Terriglobales bacterium]
MRNELAENPALVIPCSGIGKVHGLISREAAYLVTDELAPKKTATLCLALLVKGDDEAVSAVQSHACITIDGCAKACAQKNVEMAGGRVAKAIQVAEAFKNFRGAKPGNASFLTEEGWPLPATSPATWPARRRFCMTGRRIDERGSHQGWHHLVQWRSHS